LAIMIALFCAPSAVKADVSVTNVDIPDKIYTPVNNSDANCTITLTAVETGGEEYVSLPVLVNSQPSAQINLDFKTNTTSEKSGVFLKSESELIYYPFQTPDQYIEYNVTVGGYSKEVDVVARPDGTPIAIYTDVIVCVGLLLIFKKMGNS